MTTTYRQEGVEVLSSTEEREGAPRNEPRTIRYAQEESSSEEAGEAMRRSMQASSPFTPSLSHANMMVSLGANGSSLHALQQVATDPTVPTLVALTYARFQVRSPWSSETLASTDLASTD
jgi:hypothetical protein